MYAIELECITNGLRWPRFALYECFLVLVVFFIIIIIIIIISLMTQLTKRNHDKM